MRLDGSLDGPVGFYAGHNGAEQAVLRKKKTHRGGKKCNCNTSGGDLVFLTVANLVTHRFITVVVRRACRSCTSQ